MSTHAWDLLATPQEAEDSTWELFHENSKITPHDRLMPEAVANAYLAQMPESLIFEGYPEVQLPEAAAPPILLRDAIARRTVTHDFEPCFITMDAAAALLKNAYGPLDGDDARRPRAVYSEGSLFPLELFVHSVRVAGLAPGLYHYYPPGNSLRLLSKGDHSPKLAAGFLDARSAQAALTVLVAVMPERSVFRYGDRGYRFALLEAGAVVQNLALTAAALDLACANAGEFFDSAIDDVLDLDGLSISTLYVVGIGKAAEQPPRNEMNGSNTPQRR
jgi:SagB-type dehydrogenase family enzyme